MENKSIIGAWFFVLRGLSQKEMHAMRNLRILIFLSGVILLFAPACTHIHHPDTVLIGLAAKHGLEEKPVLTASFQQAWRDTPDAELNSGSVRLYQGSDAFHVVAMLRDRAIGNSAAGFNQRTWEGGDVFEIFLQTDADLYFEFHVTPENRNLFLRWESGAFDAQREGLIEFEEAFIDDPDLIETETSIHRRKGFWTVYARIPYSSVGLDNDRSARDLKVAFARYDADPGLDEPVVSATPDFPRRAFHDRSAWHPLKFEPGTATSSSSP